MHFDKIIKKYLFLIEEAKKHSTMDTYAKKLFLKKDNENLWYLKNLISGFFQYEQIKLSNLSDDRIPRRETKFDKIEGKSSRLDSRYDAFFAAMLKEKNNLLYLPQHLKMISWNYDYQLEMAYCDYADCSIGEARRHLKIFPRSIENIKKEIKEIKPNIVKLNGSADLVNIEQSKSYENSLIFSSTESVFSDEPYKEIYEFIYYASEASKNNKFTLVHNLKFSWEEQNIDITNTTINSAKKIIQDTSVLVIIGYSFPVFNREIDKEILGQGIYEKVYIQAPINDAKAIKDRFSGILDPSYPQVYPIEIIDDLTQFYIPFEV